MKVEYTVLKKNYMMHAEEYKIAARRVLESGWYVLGNELASFEKEFSSFLNVRNCIGVNSGTDALIMAIRALEIGQGDEVIVPAGSYIASVIGVTENGAIPIFVDSDEYLLIDVSKIEEKITAKTKAIIAVHMYGQVCNLSEIMAIADRHNLFVIEDCAQCHGAKFEGKMAGTLGTIGCFSFYPTKPLGAMGDAGALVTNDDLLAEKLHMMRNYGSKIKYHNEIQGINSRLDEMQAAFLRVGLSHLLEDNKKRLAIANYYLNNIKNDAIVLPKVYGKEGHVFHLFPILVERQETFQKYMEENGIETQIHYPTPPYVAECYKSWGYDIMDFEKAAYVAKHEVSIPIYSGMPWKEVKYVVQVINKYKM